MNTNQKRKQKAGSLEPRKKDCLPSIHSSSFGTAFSKKSSGQASTIGRSSVKSESLKLANSKKSHPIILNPQQPHQIMLEFIPDNFFINSSSEVNFIANPVIPNFSMSPTFPALP